MTNATTPAEPERTAEEILAAIEQFVATPRLVGHLMGIPVYVSGAIPDQVVELRGANTVRFRLDDPLIKGTKLERELSR